MTSKPNVSQSQLALIDAAIAIRKEPDAAERAFMARQLILCTLPHSDPGNDKQRWLRKSGNASLIIQPGWDAANDCSVGYPYGTIPRLILFWITTVVQYTKNRDDLTAIEKRTLELGRSLAEFMREIGLNPETGGGKRGDSKRLHNQMDRLFSSRISFQMTKDDPDGRSKQWLNMDVAPKGELWWDPRSPEQGAFWHSWIRLGEEFYDALIALPVPVDMRALRALKRSPLALDLYAWVCYRAYIIVEQNQPPRFMSWAMLSRQLGTDYSDLKDFKKYAQAALYKVETLYPGLTITPARGGFMIHATRLAVPKQPVDKHLHK